MSFTLVWPSGLTDDLSTVDAAQLMKLDSDHVASVDGVGGGTYTPSAIIVVGGEGIDHQYLADIAALKAVNTTSLLNNAVRWVAGYGRFVLTKSGAPASDAEDLPVVVQPTTGTGRWFAQDPLAIRQWTKTFTATGTFVLPRNIHFFDAYCIGGGGGGGGASGADLTTSDTCGGAGGGGSLGSHTTIAGDLAAGTWTALVGNGGSGGAANTHGVDGVASAILDPGSNFKAFCWGGGGGAGSSVLISDVGSLRLAFTPGGRAVAEALSTQYPIGYSCADFVPPEPPDNSRGGWGANSQVGSFYNSPDGSADGANSAGGGAGGSRGSRGAAGGGHIGGGAGGGGGAGPLNGAIGGQAGNGGNGSAAVGGNGGAGQAPPAGSPHYGGGGGGGGGGGTGGTPGSLGGPGGNGADGVIILTGIQ